MATKQPRKQAKSAAKTDVGTTNKPAHHHRRTPRPRTPQARSTTETSSAAEPAVAASTGAPDRTELSTNAPSSPEPLASQSAPPSQNGDLPTADVAGAQQSRASTKRAQRIGMLERPEGAAVAEIGQHLGWLPHTVRAAFTALRHAGREVTRSKDDTGRSVYRLTRVETAPDR